VKLVTNEQVVEVVEFETTHPTLRGEMTITYNHRLALGMRSWENVANAELLQEGVRQVSSGPFLAFSSPQLSIHGESSRSLGAARFRR